MIKEVLTIILLFSSTFLFGQNFGTTIITHGYQLSGNTPFDENSWPYKMAYAIIERAGGGEILTYNKATGRYDVKTSLNNGYETVLLYDWARESNNITKGFSEAAGDALFSSLILGSKKGDFTLRNLHFIGHSRGTVVNTEAIERLLVLKNHSDLYSNSISIDQVTNLDAHDWGALNASIVKDNDNHPNISIPCPSDSRPNNGTISWKGSGFNDSYYQKGNPAVPLPNITKSVILDGRPVDGTYNVDWSKEAPGHSLIHQRYIKTITSKNNDYQDGYRYSRISGEKRPQPKGCGGIKHPPEFDFIEPIKTGRSERIRGIMNGSFDRGIRNSIPGWEEHGGEIGADIVPGGFIRFSSTSGKSIKHNRFYIPNDIPKISFKLMIERIGNSVEFEAYINDELAFSETCDSITRKFEKKYIDISRFANQVVTLEFRVNAPIGSFYSTQIALDDVQFSLAPDESSTLFLFDLSGSMNDNGGGTIPKVEQAKNASKQTLDGMRSNGQDVANQVAVYGFSGSCVPDPTIEISPFDNDLDKVEQKINTMRAGGGTPLGNAIRAAECKMAAHLQKEGQKEGKIILLSDGQGTCGSIRPSGVYNSAPLQRNRHITVDASQCGGAVSNSSPSFVSYYTVGFNIPPGSPAERDLQYLSQLSGGKYLNVQNQTQLTRAFRKFNRTYRPKRYPKLSPLPSASTQAFSEGVKEIREEYFDEALAHYTQFVKDHPDDCHGVYNLAISQEANDYLKEAIDNYKKYLSLCSSATDRAFVEKQIKFLEEEFQDFVVFQKEVVQSDLAYLQLHFERIQNGQSVALAEEFKGFLREKGNYYERLPRLIASDDPFLQGITEEVSSALLQCKSLIRRNPQKWDQDAIPLISMTYLNLKDLLDEL